MGVPAPMGLLEGRQINEQGNFRSHKCHVWDEKRSINQDDGIGTRGCF